MCPTWAENCWSRLFEPLLLSSFQSGCERIFLLLNHSGFTINHTSEPPSTSLRRHRMVSTRCLELWVTVGNFMGSASDRLEGPNTDRIMTDFCPAVYAHVQLIWVRFPHLVCTLSCKRSACQAAWRFSPLPSVFAGLYSWNHLSIPEPMVILSLPEND